MNDEIFDLVKEWLAKAEGDQEVVKILSTDENCPNESVCFHCQQYVEKLLKALLTLHSVEAPRTHDLKRLIKLASPYVPGLSALADRSDRLSDHAIRSRYPGKWREIDDSEMHEMIELSKKFAAILLPLLKR